MTGTKHQRSPCTCPTCVETERLAEYIRARIAGGADPNAVAAAFSAIYVQVAGTRMDEESVN